MRIGRSQSIKILLSRYPKLRELYAKCFFLNGIFILFSVTLFEGWILPSILLLSKTIASVLICDGNKNTHYEDFFLGGIVQVLYSCLWTTPMLLVSLIINTTWYTKMAEIISRHHEKGTFAKNAYQKYRLSEPEFAVKSSHAIYRLLFISVLSLQLLIFQNICLLLPRLIWSTYPLFAILLKIAALSFTASVYAYYCFEYE